MANTPTHIGFIIDGNRRWAKQKGKSTFEGHLAGCESLKTVLLEAVDRGVKYASAYIFSTENWKRSEEEVHNLMGLTTRIIVEDSRIFIEKGIRVRILGSRDRLPQEVIDAVNEIEESTKDLANGTVALCLNYGGQQEIADAVKKIIENKVSAEDITPELIEQNLYSPDVPPCDLIVRTSSEQRLSNFMLWRSAYSELLFLDKYWPDMTKEDVSFILGEYEKRKRRFGG